MGRPKKNQTDLEVVKEKLEEPVALQQGELKAPSEPNFKRNERGLLDHVDYIYRSDGYIDWRAMVEPEFIGVKNDYKDEVEKKYGKVTRENIKEVDDKYLFVLLGGFKKLAQLRGILEVDSVVSYVSDYKAVVKCRLVLIGNYETDGIEVSYSGIATASHESVHRDFTPFLESIAENRAFVRAVRSALGINIVGFDELSTAEKEKKSENEVVQTLPDFTVQALLEQKATQKGVSFNALKKRVLEAYADQMKGDPNKWESFRDICADDCYIISSKMEKKE